MATFTKEQQTELDDLMMKGDVIAKALNIEPHGYMPGISFIIPEGQLQYKFIQKTTILGTQTTFNVPSWLVDKLYEALK